MSIPDEKARHLFPGGNTSSGFYSFYDQIIEADSAARIFILKGGPGVGKSTFMKGLGKDLLEIGYEVEFHHCSADSSSLDAVMFPSLRVAVIDGTSPHIVDPKNPGVVDDLLPLGDFWDETVLTGAKERVISLSQEIRGFFDQAYHYLKATETMRQSWSIINERFISFEKVMEVVAKIRSALFKKRAPAKRTGGIRKLFACAITPDGPVSYLESLFGRADHLYLLEGPPGAGQEMIVEKVLASAVENGKTVEAYFSPFDPKRPEHLWFPEQKAGIVTSGWPFEYHPQKEYLGIDTKKLLLEKDLASLEAEKEIDPVVRDLFDRAVKWLQRAKRAHDELEGYYLPAVDFAGIERLRQKTLRRILDLNQKDSR